MDFQDDLACCRANLQLVLRARIKNPHLVEDLCQTVLMKCWVHFQRKGALPSIPFIRRAGLNEFRSWLRRRKPQFLRESYDQVSKGPEPSEVLDEKEKTALVLTA